MSEAKSKGDKGDKGGKKGKPAEFEKKEREVVLGPDGQPLSTKYAL